MTWNYLNRNVAEPFEMAPQLRRVLGGYELSLHIKLHALGWPGWQHAPRVGFTIFPTMSEVKIAAGASRRPGSLGYFHATPNTAFDVMLDPKDQQITYVGQLSEAAMYELEELRRGEVFHINADMFADGYIGRNYVEDGTYVGPGYTQSGEATYVGASYVGMSMTSFSHKIDHENWLQQLHAVGYSDNVLFEVPMPKGSSDKKMAEAVARLKEALADQQQGKDEEAIRKCRIALNAVELSGYGGRRDDTVVNFIKHRANSLSMAERFAAVRTALELYFNQAHHAAGAHPLDYGRVDSTFALASVASLLMLAPRRGKPDPEEDK